MALLTHDHEPHSLAEFRAFRGRMNKEILDEGNLVLTGSSPSTGAPTKPGCST